MDAPHRCPLSPYSTDWSWLIACRDALHERDLLYKCADLLYKFRICVRTIRTPTINSSNWFVQLHHKSQEMICYWTVQDHERIICYYTIICYCTISPQIVLEWSTYLYWLIRFCADRSCPINSSYWFRLMLPIDFVLCTPINLDTSCHAFFCCAPRALHT